MVDSAAQTIARAVRARRLELHLSTHEASERARIPEKSWRVIEQGFSRPSGLMLDAVCKVLDWTPATIESLLHDELQVNGAGEMVVDLDARDREVEQPVADAAATIPLDVRGLTAAELADVQAYIDFLRERFS